VTGRPLNQQPIEGFFSGGSGLGRSEMARTATPPLQPLPEIVDSHWICGRYLMSPRMLDRHIQSGKLHPFKPGQRRLRFYTRDVIEAFEGPKALKGRTFLASQPENVPRRKYPPRPTPKADEVEEFEEWNAE